MEMVTLRRYFDGMASLKNPFFWAEYFFFEKKIFFLTSQLVNENINCLEIRKKKYQ
jgi:hypothetical protein